MRVVYHDPVRQPGEVESALNAAYVSSDELLRTSDFVVRQMPYVRETHHMIGAAQLAMMKCTSILINAGRGGLVDDAVLAEALAQGRLRAAGLDTFEGEPAVHPGLLGLRNVVLTPHVGSATEGTRRSMAMTAARNAVAALTGRAPPHRVPPAPMT